MLKNKDEKPNQELLVEKKPSSALVREMMAAGVHLGHRTSKLHPRMESFIIGIRNTIHVIDLEKTETLLKQALDFIEKLIKDKGILLFVGTKIPLRKLVKETAEQSKAPFVINRWLGGTFTNFHVISKRIKYFLDAKTKKADGSFEKYTKKERIKLNQELDKLTEKFEGIASLEKLPDAVFICDIVRDDLALKEAKMKGVKTIAIIDTNADPTAVDYPIPANDDAISSVKYILEKVKETIQKNK